MKPLALALALTVLAGCATTASTPATVRARLVGTWSMETITDAGRDVSAAHNPAGDRFIVLRADGQFESGGQPYGRNTGRWTYDPDSQTLGLDSDAGPEDDSRWVVRLHGNVMEWRGVGSDFARRFEITSRRVR